MKVSRLCLGGMSWGGTGKGPFSWSLGYEGSKPIIERAIDLGINFYDTGDSYSEGTSEEILGRVLEGRRNDLIIATKVHHPTGEGPNDKGLSRKHIRLSIRSSLQRLKTDYVDLYQVHRWDYTTPLEETLTTLNSLVHAEGVVNHIGASSMFAWQFATALFTSDRLGLERFVSMQNHYNLCYREEEVEMIPLCRSQDIAIMPYSPLARGFLSGKYKRGKNGSGPRYEKDRALKERYFTDADFNIVDRVEEVARRKGVAIAQVALAWLLHKVDTIPVVGVTSAGQLDELVGALDVGLAESEMTFLEEPYRRRPTVGPILA